MSTMSPDGVVLGQVAGTAEVVARPLARPQVAQEVVLAGDRDAR